jgi:hypothetical protein
MRNVHLTRIQIAVGMALASLQIHGGCGPCPDTVTTMPLLPKMNGPDAASEPLPPVGKLSVAECQTICGSGVASCQTYIVEGGTTEAVECTFHGQCGAGRRPAGLVVRGGAMLARMAALEAASVDAFRILERELRQHGAPKRILGACRRSAREEMRHARSMDALARRAGAKPCRVARSKPRRRSLDAIARENAREGCVGEAWGALLARVQATTATDPHVRATMATIADDEARHAALSWEVDAWIARERPDTRLERTKRSHAKRLLRDVSRMKPSPSLGLPSGPDAVRLATALFASLGVL